MHCPHSFTTYADAAALNVHSPQRIGAYASTIYAALATIVARCDDADIIQADVSIRFCQRPTCIGARGRKGTFINNDVGFGSVRKGTHAHLAGGVEAKPVGSDRS